MCLSCIVTDCHDNRESLISKAESVSTKIRQPPPSHKGDPIFTLLMTFYLSGPLKSGKMRTTGRVEWLEWVRTESDGDESRRDKESENVGESESSSHESQLLFSGCHLWYMPLRPTNLNGLPTWPDKLNQLKVFCPQLSRRTVVNS